MKRILFFPLYPLPRLWGIHLGFKLNDSEGTMSAFCVGEIVSFDFSYCNALLILLVCSSYGRVRDVSVSYLFFLWLCVCLKFSFVIRL